MMSEDIAGQTIGMAQKSAEIVVEIARLLRQMCERSEEHKRVKQQNKIQQGEKIELKTGEVSIDKIKEGGNPYMVQANIFTADRAAIVNRAKQYDIPVAFIGKDKGTESLSAAFRTQDKELFAQIMQDVMKDKLAAKPNDYLVFNTENLGAAETLQNMFKSNDIPVDIVKSDKGYQCLYEAKNAEAVKIIKDTFKEAHNEVKDSFNIAENGKKYSLSDVSQNKSITLSSLPTKEKLMRICREQFGFDEPKALEAAHKFESTLSGDKLKYFLADTRQAALLDRFERNIKLSDDSLLTKPFSFAKATFSSDKVNRYLVSDGERAVSIIPQKMKRAEIEQAIKEKLGLESAESISAIANKVEKIEAVEKIKTLEKQGELNNKPFSIERTSDSIAVVSQGNNIKSYDLRDKAAALKAMQNDFEISEAKAGNIYAKANRQSTLQNSFHKMAAEKLSQAKDALKHKLPTQGVRK